MTRIGVWRPLAGFVAFAFVLLGAAAVSARDRLAQPGEVPALLATAEAGDTLLLAPGDHGRLRLDGNLPEGLTLRAADPTDRPVIRTLLLRGVADMTLAELDLAYDGAGANEALYRPFQLIDVADVHLRDLRISGHTVDLPEGLDLPVSVGLYLERVAGVTIADSAFSDHYRGLAVDGASGMEVTGSQFRRSRDVAIRLAAVRDIRIEGNRISDFARGNSNERSPAMILVESGEGDRRSARIAIRGNVLSVGDGKWTRSIVLRNPAAREVAAGWRTYFEDVLIEENVILNAQIDGITVDEADGLTIRRNSVLRAAYAQGGEGRPELWTPTIRVAEQSRNVAVLGNVAPGLPEVTWQDTWIVAGNVIVQDQHLSDPNFYDDVFHAVTPSRSPRLSDFAARPGGVLDGKPVGAPMLARIEPDTVTAPAPLRRSSTWRALWLDPQDGTLKAKTGAGRDPRTLALTGPSIGIGWATATVQVSRDMTAPIYGADALRLVMGLRPRDESRSVAGEILRIHESFIVSLSDRGVLQVALKTDSGKWVRARSGRLNLSPDTSVRVEIRYAAESGVLSIHDADGAEIGRAVTVGRIKPAESWGLAIGNPFGDRPSFDGDLTEFEVHVRHPAQPRAGFRP